MIESKPSFTRWLKLIWTIPSLKRGLASLNTDMTRMLHSSPSLVTVKIQQSRIYSIGGQMVSMSSSWNFGRRVSIDFQSLDFYWEFIRSSWREKTQDLFYTDRVMRFVVYRVVMSRLVSQAGHRVRFSLCPLVYIPESRMQASSYADYSLSYLDLCWNVKIF